jgi:hypothetical protein
MMLEHIWVGGLAKILSGQKDNGCWDLFKAGEPGHTQASEAIKEYCKSDTSCISMIMFYRNSRGLSLYVSFFKRIARDYHT